jgi:hypothetical protein
MGSFIVCERPNIIRQIKSRRIRWAGYAWERKEKCTRFWWESPKERDHSEDRGVDGRMGLKWILRRLAGRVWSEFAWPREEIVSGLL